MEGIGAACAVSSAVESGLLLALSADARPVDAIARELSLAPQPVQLVLDVLVAEGLASRLAAGYAASPALADSLRAMPRHGLLPLQALPVVLRGGERAVEMDKDPETRAAAYRQTTPALADMFAEAASVLAERLGPVGRVLDLGCGAGVWSLAMAERDADANVVGVDFEEVTGAMLERADELGLARRVRTEAADLRTDPLPSGFDTVVLANVLRLEDASVARHMLTRAAACIAPGGRMVVVDALADETRAQKRSRALYALHLGLRTSRGHVHTRSEITAWLLAAGLDGVQAAVLPGGPAHLGTLTARRPAGDRR
jgi:SAM-dependent methyltransferase